MKVKVLIPTALRRHTRGIPEIACSATDLPELLRYLEKTFSDLAPYLYDASGQVRRFLNFYVNEEDIRFLGNDNYKFRDGDEVMIVPSIAGGCNFWHFESAGPFGRVDL